MYLYVHTYASMVIIMYVVMKQGRKEDAVLFAELHRRMSSQGVWHNGWAILHLLLVLSDEHAASPAHSIVRNLCMCVYVCADVCIKYDVWYLIVGIDKGSCGFLTVLEMALQHVVLIVTLCLYCVITLQTYSNATSRFLIFEVICLFQLDGRRVSVPSSFAFFSYHFSLLEPFLVLHC